ncbi:MAG: GNAT family N-acetyltransferase [Candidatus Caldarchaeum sp.]
MLDIVLEERYPREVTLEDGTKVTIRPMVREDEERLLEFFSTIPESERIFLQHDVTDPEVIRGWCENLNYYRVLPLLAFDGEKIVANAALKQHRRGWKSHIGNIRIVVGSAYRRKGLARKLTEELIHIALNIGLVKLQGEFMADQVAPIQTFERLGFAKVATIPEYVWDQNGFAHDLVLMVHDLRDQEYFAGD